MGERDQRCRRGDGRGPSLGARVQRVEGKIDHLEKLCNRIAEVFNVEDNSASELTKWLGKEVGIYDVGGDVLKCKLCWVDKYNYGISFATVDFDGLDDGLDLDAEAPGEEEAEDPPRITQRAIVPKGNVTRIELLEPLDE